MSHFGFVMKHKYKDQNQQNVKILLIYLSFFDSKAKVELFGTMLACLQSIHWCQGKTNQIISGVMKLSHILSRPLKRKDRLAFLLAATLGGQRKKQNMQK